MSAGGKHEGYPTYPNDSRVLNKFANLEAENARLKAELEALRPKRENPKLIGRKWAYIGLYEEGPFTEYKTVEVTGCEILGWKRLDTYQNPDGSTYVVATLEPIEGEKK